MVEQQKTFNDWPEDVIRAGLRLDYKRDDVIWRESSFAPHFYLIESGSVKLTYEDDGELNLIIAIYHAGDFFGEIQMAGLSTHNRMVVAMDDCAILRYSEQQFWILWKNHWQFSSNVFGQLCQRAVSTGDEEIFTKLKFLRHRVLRFIASNLNDHGFFRYDKEILREWTGISMRSLNRTLNELACDHLITLQGGTIRLKKHDQLGPAPPQSLPDKQD